MMAISYDSNNVDKEPEYILVRLLSLCPTQQVSSAM